MEELILKKVNGGIRAIKLGTKTPEEARVCYWLNRLKEINSVWYEECFDNYLKINKMYKQKHDNMR